MKRIYKYPLEVDDTQVIPMPKGAKILCVQVQYGKPCIWALVDPDALKVPVCFHTYGTGHDLPSTVDCEEYIGTYQLREGALVFHVFKV